MITSIRATSGTGGTGPIRAGEAGPGRAGFPDDACGAWPVVGRAGVSRGEASTGRELPDRESPAAGGGDRASAGRLLAAAAPDLAAHTRLLGPIPWRGDRGRLLPEIRDSGLTGRGGAAFPTWRKIAVAGETGRAGATGRPRPLVVANAAEGEPESGKDALLLTVAPHLVLDGLQLAGEAVGADEAVLYVKPGRAAREIARAVAERQAQGWDHIAVRVREAAGTFLAGEASAVVAALDGGPARPRAHWRPVAEAGSRGRPTLVQNVETLAHLALIARWGAGWFRSVGTADEPGTFLATVTGAVAAPGVVEAPHGIGLDDLVRLAGGPTAPVGALRVGGYSGAWLPGAAGSTVTMSRAGLAPWGAAPGAGVVSVLPADRCGLAETARIVAYLAGQNAGQCGPCVSGLPRLADAVRGMAGVADGDPGESAVRAQRLATLVAGRGACHHPDGAARLVQSALHTFAADIRAHAEGHCRGSAAPS